MIRIFKRNFVIGIFIVTAINSMGQQIPSARIDLSGWNWKVPLKPLKSPKNGFLRNATWGKVKDRKYTLTCEFGFDNYTDVKTVEFSFMPEQTGSIKVALMAKPLSHFFSEAAYHHIQVTGAKIENGDFSGLNSLGLLKDWKSSPGVKIKKAKKGNIVIASVKYRIVQTINVTKGKQVTIKVTASAVKPRKISSVSTGIIRKIQMGKWSFSLDSNNGKITYLTYGKTNICRTMSRTLFVNSSLPIYSFKLLKYVCDTKKRDLKLYLAYDNWLIIEKIDFDAYSSPGLISRSAGLELASSGSDVQPEAFNSLSMNYTFDRKGRYMIPVSLLGDTRGIRSIEFNPQAAKQYASLFKTNVTELPVGTRVGPQKWTNPLLFEHSGKSLFFINDDRRDKMNTFLNIKKNDVVITQKIHAAGWAYPGKRQQIGTAFMRVCPEPMEQALSYAVRDWFDKINFQVPIDRKDNVARSSVFELNCNYFLSEKGFNKIVEHKIMERIKQMGFNTLWIMPVEAGGIYHPSDYYAIKPVLGTRAEYKNLIKAAHKAGLKVLQDLVPHGSYPKDGIIRNNDISCFKFDRYGNAGSYGKGYFAMDYKSQKWQKYIGNVAAYYLKQFDVDGFRIDSSEGSPTNWRRKGFPAGNSSPKNIDSHWFREAVKKNGGELPDINHERGSLSQREGGMEMIRTIRKEVKKHNPEGWVLAEVPDSMYMQAGDAIYDFIFRLLVFKIPEMTPANFASGLARRMQEQLLTDPRDTIRMRYVETHDGIKAVSYIGIGAYRALTAAVFFMRGIPLVFIGNDIGDGIFLRQLNELRNSREELIFGSVDYIAVKSSNPAVLCILRKKGQQVSIGAVNLSCDSIKTELTIPESLLQQLALKKCFIQNMMNGQKLKKSAVNKVDLSLKPWGSALLAFKDIGEKTEHKLSVKKYVEVKSKLKVEKTASEVIVNCDNYSLILDRRSGMIKAYSVDGSLPLLKNADLLVAGKPETLPAAAVNVKCEKNGSIRISVKNTFDKAELKINYVCFPAEVNVSASLSGKAGGEYAALVLPSYETNRWQVNTIDGMLDDFILSPQKINDNLLPIQHDRLFKLYRNRCKFVLWESAYQLWDPKQPVIRLFNKAGKGCEIVMDNPYENAPANSALIRIPGAFDYPAGVFYFHDSGVLSGNASGSFSFRIKPICKKDTPPESFGEFRKGKLTFRSESTNYVVENDYFKVKLSRIGGNIRKLQSCYTGETLISDQRLFTQGLVNRRRNPDSNIYDPAGALKVWWENDVLRLRFQSIFIGEHRYDLPWRNLWSITDYAFNSSGAFKVRYSIMGERGAITDAPEVYCSMNVSGSGAKSIVLDGTAARNHSGEIDFSLLKGQSYQPGKYFSREMSVLVPGSVSSSSPNLKAMEKLHLIPDYSFELWGNAWLANAGKSIPFQVFSEAPGFGIGASVNICVDRTKSSEGMVSAKLTAGGVVRLFQIAKELKTGKYLLKADVCGKDLSKDAQFKISIAGGRGLQRKQIGSKNAALLKYNKWKTLEVPFEITHNMLYPSVCLRCESKTGVIWLDNITIEKI